MQHTKSADKIFGIFSSGGSRVETAKCYFKEKKT